MVIKELCINNFGGTESLALRFHDGVNTLHYHATGELSYALKIIFNHKKIPSLPTYWVRKDTKISARVFICEQEFFLEATPDKYNRLVLCARDCEGNDVTEEYGYLSSHCEEQDSMEVFNGGAKESFLNFLRYLDENNYFFPKALSKNTEGLSDMRAFRAYLAQFICEFKPEKIRGEKQYVIALKKDGTYDIQHEGTLSSLSCLSNTDQKLFQYLCFLNTAEFWNGFENIRNLHCIKKPLIIENFLEHLDVSVDIQHLMARTENLKRQSIILTA